MHGTGERAVPADQIEHRKAVVVSDDGLTIDQERVGRQGRKRCDNKWKAGAKSLPLRVNSRTPAPPRLAMMQKPSCLIS
jgi:hypothetical protein